MSQGIYQGFKVEKGAACLLCCGEGAMFFNEEQGIFMTNLETVFDNIKMGGYAAIKHR